MIPIERHEAILSVVSEKGIATINELIELLDVSHMTIRRDLQKLEKKGKVITVSGGVKAAERLSSELTHKVKEALHEDGKRMIGALAANEIPPNSCVFLDSGTTTLAIARQIKDREDLTIITNDFLIMFYLIENGRGKLIHTGGTVCPETNCSVGESAARGVENYLIDIAFVSAPSWGLKGVSLPTEERVPIKKVLPDISKRLVLVADNSKYGAVATYLALPLSAFDTIITDGELPSEISMMLHNRDITLITPEANFQSFNHQ
ncbi:DeoR family transcriptional regulator [Ignatzschineria sp. LJL83]